MSAGADYTVSSTAARSRTTARSMPAVTVAMWACAAALVLLHVAVLVVDYRLVELAYEWRSLFDLDEEQSFGTWLAAVLHLRAAQLCLERRRSDGRRVMGHYWRLLALGFLVLSLDEVAGLHESLNTAIEMSWTLPAMVLVLALAIALSPFVARLDAGDLAWFVAAGLLFLGGAIGVEYLTEPHLHADRLDTLGYNLTTALDEGMEMAGMLLFITRLETARC